MTQSRIAAVLLLAAIPLVAALTVLPPSSLYDGGSGSTLLQARAIAEGEGWPRPIPYPASDLDPEGACLPRSLHVVEGGTAAVFPVIFPLLLSPLVALGGQRALLLLPLLGGIASAWLAARLARQLEARTRAPGVAAACLLATPLAFCSVVLWEHTLATALLVGALLIAALYVGRGTYTPWGPFGFLIGLAPWLRGELLVMLPLLFVPGIVAERFERRRATVRSCAGGALGLTVGVVVQRLVVGTWLPIQTLREAALEMLEFPFLASRRASLSALFAPDVWTRAAAAAWLVALFLVVATRQRGVRVVRLLAVLSMALVWWAALGMPAVRFLQGMVSAAAFPVGAATSTWIILSALPIALTGVPRWGGVRRNRLLLAATAGWLVVACGLGLPVADSRQWGAPFLLPAVVLGTVLMLTAPASLGRWEPIRRLLVQAAVVAGVAVQLLGVALLHQATHGNVALTTAVETVTALNEVVVCDTSSIPELAVPIWKQRRFLWCSGREVAGELLERLATAGVRRWALAYVDEERSHSREPAALLPGGRGAVWRRDGSLAMPVSGRTLRVVWYARD